MGVASAGSDMPAEEGGSGDGPDGGGGEGRSRGFKFVKKGASKRLSSKDGKKQSLAQRDKEDQDQMFKMLRNVAIGIGTIFVFIAVYSFSKSGSLKVPDGYYG